MTKIKVETPNSSDDNSQSSTDTGRNAIVTNSTTLGSTNINKKRSIRNPVVSFFVFPQGWLFLGIVDFGRVGGMTFAF